jgi:PPK2 family polyphosphate:nucleotide phosphotransferase
MAYAQRPPKGAWNLNEIDPRQDGGLDRAHGEQRTEELGRELDELFELLFAAGLHGLLVVLQGRDTAGKDGVIRTLLSHTDVQSARVAPFKVPTERELRHDFLWRVHQVTPARGEVVLFNRSHYEDVLVVRVHQLVPEAVWRPRYEQIDAFESLLVAAGTIIVKFFLHISPEEQRERLLAREASPEKSWKLNPGDWRERAYWDAFTEAYEEAIRRCDHDDAPWYIVPSDRKWFRDLAVTEALVTALRPYRKAWETFLAEQGKAMRAELEAFRRANPNL